MPDWEDTQWESEVRDGTIPGELADFLIDAGYDSPESIEGHSGEIIRNEDGEWWAEIDGERVTEVYTDEDNELIWEFYDWWEFEYDEPPEKDITSGESAT